VRLVVGICLTTLGLAQPAVGSEGSEGADKSISAGSSSSALLPNASARGLAWGYWMPRDQMPAEQADTLPRYCEGRYRPLKFPYPESVDGDSLPIVADAQSAAYWIDGDVLLDGQVHLAQGNRSIAADQVRLDRATRDAQLTGQVLVLEPGVAAQGTRGQVNLDTQAASLEEVEFLLLEGGMRGEADSLKQDEQGNLKMVAGSYTRCEPGNNSWRVTSTSVQIAEGENWAVARNAVLRVKDVPIFYAPRISIPVTDERLSGFLFPTIGYSSEDGTEIGLPYYLNLAPNYDATLVPRYVSKRGWGLESEFRYLSGWQESVFSGAFLPNDDKYDGKLTRSDFDERKAQGRITGEFEPADRWLIALDHRGEEGPFRTLVDYTAVSDRDYFRDLESYLDVSSQIALERLGQIEYSAGGLDSRLWVQRFDRLDDVVVDPYQRLPQLDLTYTGRLVGPLEWSLGTQAVSFDRDNNDLVGIGRAVGNRIHLEPRLRLPLSWPWGFLTLTGGYRHTLYDLRDMPDLLDESPERTIGLGSARAGLVVERELSLFETSVVQTLEPELFYLYQQYEDQSDLPNFDAAELTFGYSQLFRDNRFSGLDRIGDANQLSVGLTTRFLNPLSGREYLRASVGQIVYFEDREVTISGAPTEEDRESSSSLAGELSGRLPGQWQLTGTVIWDPHDNQLEEGGAAVQYRRDNQHIVNLGYRYLGDQDVDQTDVSFYWPMSKHYSVLGRWNYDLINNRTIEGFLGLEYNNCCFQVRLFARRFIDSPSGSTIEDVEADDGLFLQVVFKGLAGIGDKVESVLEKGIRGYRTEDYNEF
jgi:LPS-assembly protein